MSKFDKIPEQVFVLVNTKPDNEDDVADSVFTSEETMRETLEGIENLMGKRHAKKFVMTEYTFVREVK